MNRKRLHQLMVLLSAVALLLSACSSGDGDGAASGDDEAQESEEDSDADDSSGDGDEEDSGDQSEEDASADGESKGEIIAFTFARSERYVAGLIEGLNSSAEAAGYEITVIENDFDQAQQDEQVQQQLAAGQEPDLWIWWPAEGAAGLGSLRDLAATGIPVLQINQLPTDDAREFVTAYAGPDDALRARNTGIALAEARDELEAAGAPLSGDAGNLIAATYPTAYGGYPLSIEAFQEGIEGSGVTVLAESNEGFGSQNGYNGVSQLVAQVRDEGIDLLYGMDDAILQGAIQALEEAGFTVGVPEMVADGEADDVIVAAGTVCNGDRQLLEERKQYSTTLQSPLFEGQLAIQTADQIIQNGEADEFLNFTPNPAVRYDEWEDFTLEGYDGVTYTMDELCSWN